MASPPLIFVHEYFTGGGCSQGCLHPGELPATGLPATGPPATGPPGGLSFEALGMLWAVLVEFRRWGAFRTRVVFDTRFENCVPGLDRASLPADEVIPAIPGRFAGQFAAALQGCDAALLIAPETGGVLAGLAAKVEASGRTLLGGSAAAVALAGDKAACSRLFAQAGLPAPATCVASFAEAPRLAGELGYPLVVKPLDGVGGEGVCRVDGPQDLPHALNVLRSATSHPQILLQAFVVGTHASVSLLVADGRCLPLSLNLQRIEADVGAGCPFRYLGGQVPLEHPAANAALELACAAAALVPGLRGYAGVDLVLGERGAWLIEINPRLTTSVIGLRQVAQFNLAQAIWEACVPGCLHPGCKHPGSLPAAAPLAGRSVFTKDDPSTWGLSIG